MINKPDPILEVEPARFYPRIKNVPCLVFIVTASRLLCGMFFARVHLASAVGDGGTGPICGW